MVVDCAMAGRDDAVAAREQSRDQGAPERASGTADECHVAHDLSSVPGGANRLEEFPSQVRVAERASPERRGRPGVLLDAAHARAEVRGLEMNGDAVRSDEPGEGVRDLLAEPLLHGEAPREQPDDPRQLGEPDDLLARDVADVGAAVERKRVMFAQARERDRPSMICPANSRDARCSAGNTVTSLGSPSYPAVAS